MRFPEFIESAIQGKNTSVGDNKCFKDKGITIPTNLINRRYNQVVDSIKKKFGRILTVDDAMNLLSSKLRRTIEIEKPLRSQLENLVKSTVNEKLGVPQETVILDCRLVDRVKPDMSLRILPEETKHSFSDVELDANDEILKRRVVNSLIQGVSYLMMMATYDNELITEWDKDLPKLYGEIIALNDFLLFLKEEEISDEHPMLGAHVETILGDDEEKTIIDAQGLIYPLLLQETYRGFFEMFASNGLPDNIQDARFVINKADITVAEAWDLRLGVPFWQTIDKLLPDDTEPSVYPYIFSSIVIKPTNEFNDVIYDSMTEGFETKKWFNKIIQQVKHDKEYQLFKNDIEKYNIEKALITDSKEQD